MMNLSGSLETLLKSLMVKPSLVKFGILSLVLAASFVGFSSLISSSTAHALPNGSEAPAPAPFDAATTCNKQDFFGLVPWYQYMNKEFTDPYARTITPRPNDICQVKCFNVFIESAPNDCGQTASDIPAVLLAIVDDLLRIAALVAIGFVIYGAFQYTASQGNPEVTSQAQSTIINALIGVAIALIAVTAVSFIGDKVGG